MQGSQTSRPVSSNQAGVHEKLTKLVTRHLAHRSLRPLPQHTVRCLETVLASAQGRPLVLDSGCGTGTSTPQLAQAHPECFVVGIDKSGARLETAMRTHPPRPADNYLFIRADLEDFLRACSARSMQLHAHYLLYPNPWPKKSHLQRRLHGSACFRQIIELGGQVELRTNWRTYAEEFLAALAIAGIQSKLSQLQTSQAGALTRFEAKYHASGHALWLLRAKI